jgi:hypothetical protein
MSNGRVFTSALVFELNNSPKQQTTSTPIAVVSRIERSSIMIKQTARNLKVETISAKTKEELTNQVNYFLENNPELVIQEIQYNTCASPCGASDDMSVYVEYSALIIYLMS